MAANAKVAGERLGTHDWLAGALEVLGREGIEAVHIEPLARQLGVTKGSFYWHFRDRQELLDRLLGFWETEMTDKTGASLGHPSGHPRRDLLEIVEYIERQGINQYDAAVRAWALYDEGAAEVVRRVDEKRLEFVFERFVEMGFSAEQAEVRGRAWYYYVVGQHSAAVDQPPLKDRLAQIRLRLELLAGG